MCDPLDLVGAGVGVGAGAGADDGGASVGAGLGADEVGWLAGCELLAGPLLGEAAADREPADADPLGCADADRDALAVPVGVGVVPDVGEPLAL